MITQAKAVTATVLADVAPPQHGGGSGHVALTVVCFILAAALLVLVFAAISRRK